MPARACFITGQFAEIRIAVAYSEANVRLVGTHAGVAIGEDGHSQMGLEDIALMRTLPGMAVLQPADDIETTEKVEFHVGHRGPAFLRLTRQLVERHLQRVLLADDVAQDVDEGAFPVRPQAMQEE